VSIDYELVARRANHRCEYCHAPEDVFNMAMEIDHILPRAAISDTTDPANLALSCRSCNLYKSDFVAGPDHETASSVPLFHPRKDTWGAHFALDTDSGQVRGISPTGRATVERLRINSPHQIAARRQWILLGLFP
jgi:hypothetical protein